MLSLEDGRKLVQILKQLDYNHDTALNKNTLSQLFFQSKRIDKPSTQLINQFGVFFRKKILINDNGKTYSTIRVVPFYKYYFIVDSPLVASTGGLEKYISNRDNLYGYIGSDGMRLTNYIFPKIRHQRYKNGLDLCAGSGIVGIALSPLFEYMHGVDIDKTAADWMQFNAQLNGIENYTSHYGDLYMPVESLGPFDLIIANPSYCFYPPEIMEKYQIKSYETAGEFGTALTVRIMDGFKEYLSPEGTGCICTFTPILNGKDYLLQKISERFSKFDYEFEIYYDFQCMLSDFKEYYNGLGITRFCFVIIKVQKGRPFKIRKRYSGFYYLSQIPMLVKIHGNLNRLFRNILNSLYFRIYCYRSLP